MFSDYLVATAQSSEFMVEASASRLGNDIVVWVGGGCLHHIGAVSLAVYEPDRDSATVSTVCVYSHRDDAVSSYFAKRISREMKCTVSVSAGIHIDDADEEQIKSLTSLSYECCEKIIKLLKTGGETI